MSKKVKIVLIVLGILIILAIPIGFGYKNYLDSHIFPADSNKTLEQESKEFWEGIKAMPNNEDKKWFIDEMVKDGMITQEQADKLY